ncbi:hypothetical protein M3Y99_00336300 [Aphelenchoides fujianensis]|nr:hypothetical protein M3Y99_00336300 [Aphelenchoides fujianensis]
MADKGCPASYSCQYAVSFQRYQCCGKEPIDEDEDEFSGHTNGCMHDQVAFIPEGTKMPQVCTASGPNTCPLGYFCQFSETNKMYQCCAQKAGCPGTGVAYIGMSGAPEPCQVGLNNTCPVGYSCQQTKHNRDVCCTFNDPKTTSEKTERKAEKTSSSKEEAPVDSKHEGDDEGRSKETHEGDHHGEKPTSRLATAVPRVHNVCRPNEQLRNGICLSRKIGDACVTTDQCPKTSVCSSHTCRCPDGTKQEHNLCIPDMDEEQPITPIRTSSRGQTGGGDDEEKEEAEAKPRKCKADEILFRGHCLKRVGLGETCVTKEQCLNGAHCYRGKCRCPPNKAGYQGSCIENACGHNQFRMPQLDQDTNVVVCSEDKGACTSPHRCSYSKILSEYICCKSSTALHRPLPPVTSAPEFATLMPIATSHRPRPIPSTRRRKRCPNDDPPLLFPHTNQPIKCTPNRACPKQYFCTQSICCPGMPTTTPSFDEEEE